MNEPPLKLGDVVYLKSGSPAFTVTELHESRATVTWWDDGKIGEATLLVHALTKTNRSEEDWSDLESAAIIALARIESDIETDRRKTPEGDALRAALGRNNE